MESCLGEKGNGLRKIEDSMIEELGRSKVKLWMAVFSFDTLENVVFTCLITSLLALACFLFIHFNWTTSVPRWLALAMVSLALVGLVVRCSVNKNTEYDWIVGLGYVVGVCILTNTPWLPVVVLMPLSVGVFVFMVVHDYKELKRYHERLIWQAGEMSKSHLWKCLVEVAEKDIDRLLRQPIDKFDHVIIQGQQDPYFQNEKNDLSALLSCLERVTAFFKSSAEKMSSHESLGTTNSPHAYMLGVYMESSYRKFLEVLDDLAKDEFCRSRRDQLLEMAKKIVPADAESSEATPENPV